MELEQRPPTVPYEAEAGKAYGPAPSWNWRPEGEIKSEVIVSAKAEALKGKIDEAKRRLADYALKARNEPGCLDYKWYQSSTNPAEFQASIRFVDKAAYDLHLKSELSSKFNESEKLQPSLGPVASADRVFQRFIREFDFEPRRKILGNIDVFV